MMLVFKAGGVAFHNTQKRKVFWLAPVALQLLANKFLFHLLDGYGSEWIDRQRAIASFAEQTAAAASASSQPSGSLTPTEVAALAAEAAQTMLGDGQDASVQGLEQAVL